MKWMVCFVLISLFSLRSFLACVSLHWKGTKKRKRNKEQNHFQNLPLEFLWFVCSFLLACFVLPLFHFGPLQTKPIRKEQNKPFISHSGCNTLEMEWNVGFFVLFSSFPFAFFMLSFHSIIKKQRGKGQTGGVSVGVVKGTKWRKHALISFVFLSFPFNSPHYFIISEWGMRNERRRERKEERGNCVLFSFNSRTLFYSFVIKWKEHNSPLSFPSPFFFVLFSFRSFLASLHFIPFHWKGAKEERQRVNG